MVATQSPTPSLSEKARILREFLASASAAADAPARSHFLRAIEACLLAGDVELGESAWRLIAAYPFALCLDCNLQAPPTLEAARREGWDPDGVCPDCALDRLEAELRGDPADLLSSDQVDALLEAQGALVSIESLYNQRVAAAERLAREFGIRRTGE